MSRRRHFVIWPLLIAALVAGYNYFSAEKVTNPETGRRTRVALSSEQEEQLGLQSYSEVLSQSDVVSSGPEHDLVVRVARRLAGATGTAARVCGAIREVCVGLSRVQAAHAWSVTLRRSR